MSRGSCYIKKSDSSRDELKFPRPGAPFFEKWQLVCIFFFFVESEPYHFKGMFQRKL